VRELRNGSLEKENTENLQIKNKNIGWERPIKRVANVEAEA